MKANDLAQEWTLLQNQFDNYEKSSLHIKLASIVLTAIFFIVNSNIFVATLIILILWFQDAIWKTFQSRIETRLLQVESYLKEDLDANNKEAYQFNSEFAKVRSGTLSLMVEYTKQACRPTIAFPHLVLVVIVITSAAV